MCAFQIGSQKCICFDTLAERMIQKANTREGEDTIVAGRYAHGRFITTAAWYFSEDNSAGWA
jgi:hypothetical protein